MAEHDHKTYAPATEEFIRDNDDTYRLWELIDSSNPGDLYWKVKIAGTISATFLAEAWPDNPVRKADSIIVCSTVGGTPHGANIQPTAIPLRIITPTGELVTRPALNFETLDLEPLRMYTTVDHGKAQVIYSGYNVSTGLFDILNMYTESTIALVEPNGIGAIMWDENNNTFRLERAWTSVVHGTGQVVFAGWETQSAEPMPIPVNQDSWVAGSAGRGISMMGYRDDSTERKIIRIDEYDNLKTQDHTNKTSPYVYNMSMPTMNTIYNWSIAMPAGNTVKKLRFRLRNAGQPWQIGYDAALANYESIPEGGVIEEEDLKIETQDFYFRCPSAGSQVMEITVWV